MSAEPARRKLAAKLPVATAENRAAPCSGTPCGCSQLMRPCRQRFHRSVRHAIDHLNLVELFPLSWDLWPSGHIIGPFVIDIDHTHLRKAAQGSTSRGPIVGQDLPHNFNAPHAPFLPWHSGALRPPSRNPNIRIRIEIEPPEISALNEAVLERVGRFPSSPPCFQCGPPPSPSRLQWRPENVGNPPNAHISRMRLYGALVYSLPPRAE